jgi:hypothetical protein
MIAGLRRRKRIVVGRRFARGGRLAVADDRKWVDGGEPGYRRYAPGDCVQGKRNGSHSAQKMPDARSHVLVGPIVVGLARI